MKSIPPKRRISVRHLLSLSLFLTAVAFAGESPAPEVKPGPDIKPAPEAAVTAPASPVAGTPPVFPVKSEFFDQIADDYTDTDGAMQIEKLSLLQIIGALKASSPEHLKANLDSEATFKKLMVTPEKFRGRVVTFDSSFRYVYPASNVLDGEPGSPPVTLHGGQVSSGGQLISFASLEPLPTGLQPGDTVRFTGIFMKRYAYMNKRMPGVELTWTPLIIVKKLEPYKVEEAPTLSNSTFLGIVVFIIVGVVLFIVKKGRNDAMVARSNPFTQFKRDRDGPSTLFPKSRGKK